MSRLQAVSDYLRTYGQMNIVQIDRIEIDNAEVNGFGISPTGNKKIIEDLAGNKTYVEQYVFLAKDRIVDALDKKDTYEFLEDFQDWVEEQNDIGNYPVLGSKYSVDEMKAYNGYLIKVEDDGTGLYQIQIEIQYYKER